MTQDKYQLNLYNSFFTRPDRVELSQAAMQSTSSPTSTTGGTTSRRLVSSGSVFEAKIGYSRAVVDGDFVFVSGCTG